MNRILLQEEIDALLSSVSESRLSTMFEDTKQRPVQTYDFKHPERISKDQIRTLRTIHDNFARMFANELSAALRTLVDVNLVSIDQETFNEYTMSLSVPNALYILSLEHTDGHVIFELSPTFLISIMDRMMGGSGAGATEGRELTLVECRVIQKVINNTVNLWNEAWAQIHTLGAKPDGFESDPQFIQIARPSDSMTIVFFEIRVRGMTYTMNIAIPYYVLEPILNKLSAQLMMVIGGYKPKEDGGEIIKERLQASHLPVRVILAQTEMKIRDFINFESDDLIKLDRKTAAEFLVTVAGKPKFMCRPGRVGRRRAVRVMRLISPEEELVYER